MKDMIFKRLTHEDNSQVHNFFSKLPCFKEASPENNWKNKKINFKTLYKTFNIFFFKIHFTDLVDIPGKKALVLYWNLDIFIGSEVFIKKNLYLAEALSHKINNCPISFSTPDNIIFCVPTLSSST